MEKEKISCDLRTYAEDVQNEFSLKNKFIPDENLFNLIRVITSVCPKLILSGRLSLHVMDLIEIDFGKRKPDLDFSLIEPLDEYEFDQIVSLLELEYMGSDYENEIGLEEEAKKPTSEILKQDLIRLFDKKNKVYIDIFNTQYQNDFSPKHENLYPVNFGIYEKNNTPPNHPWPTVESKLTPHIIYCQHPSVTISHKIKYAFYTNYGKKKKHYEDVVDLMVKHYYNIHEKLEYLNTKKKDFIKMIKISRVESLTTLKHEIEYHVYELNKRKQNEW
jgi:hypothetical protein